MLRELEESPGKEAICEGQRALIMSKSMVGWRAIPGLCDLPTAASLRQRQPRSVKEGGFGVYGGLHVPGGPHLPSGVGGGASNREAASSGA